MKQTDKIIMYDSDEAATFKTDLTGWVTGDGFYYGKDENLARYAGCTHKTCECGKIMTKSYTRCESCRHKSARERYLALPYKVWDEVAPVVEWGGDTYFFSTDELNDYMYDNSLEQIDLLFCDEIFYNPIRLDDIAQESHDDWEPDDILIEKVNEFNKFLKTLPAHSYTPGKVRTSYEPTPERSIAK